MALSRYGGITGTEEISKDFENINVAFNNVAAENDGIKNGVNKAQSDIDSHKSSSTAHDAKNIVFSGKSPGNDVEEAVDNTNDRISEIVAQSGNDITELVDARGGYTVLGDRLNASDSRLDDKANRRWFDVKDFGAVGDGINDDSDAIQNAVNHAFDQGGGMVFIPPGIYLIESTIVIPNGTISLEGLGDVSVLTGSVDILHVLETNTNLRIKNLKINPKDAANGLVYINTSMSGRSLFIDSVTFESSGTDGGSGSGVLIKASTVHATRIFNSRFVRGRIGIEGISVVNFIVSGCYFSGSKSGGITSQEWAMKFTEDNYPLEGIRITNSNIIDWTGGIYASDALDVVVQNCMIDQNDTLIVLDSCGPVRVYDNYFGARVTSDPCLKIKTSLKISSYIKIQGNTFSCNNMANSGIDVCLDADDTFNCEYTSINDNTIVGWRNYGIRYNPSKMIYSTVTDNIIPGGTNKITPTFGAGANNYVVDNQGGTGGLGGVFTMTGSGQRCFVKSVLKSLTGGSAFEEADFDISGIGFTTKPTVGFIACASNQSIIGYYMFDSSSSSATNARFRMKMDNGSNLPQGTQRFSLLLFQ